MPRKCPFPKESIDKLVIAKVFRPERAGTESEKMFVEFEDDYMPGMIYKYVWKLNHNSNIHIYIPPSFKTRTEDLENTKIRWGSGDLILEKKSKSNPTERCH